MSQLHKISGCENADRKLDVVFIHGLGGDAFKTWRHGDDESTSWPHWVGEEFPDVGVWTLGYAASAMKWWRLKRLFGGGSRDDGYAMALPDRARQVADLLIQKDCGMRPLIIVGHSLGGLLAKQVLRRSVDAVDGDPMRRIADSSNAVLFLGTPHTGAALATLGDAFKDVFGGTVALETLREHDHHLRDLYDWYRNHSPKFAIDTVTYFETRGWKGGPIKIVNPSSAHPGVGRDPVGLDEDHLTLAKPRNRDAQVCDALRDLIRKALDGPLSPRSPQVLPPTPPPPPAQPTPPPVIVNVTVPASTAGEVPTSRIPRELPPRAERYFGREAERRRLADRLRERRNTAVVGPGGLGKTALAAEALHALGEAALLALYPDGSLYLNFYETRADQDAIWSRLANGLAGIGFMEQALPRVRAEEACRGRRALLIIEGGEEADGREGRAELAALLSVVSAETTRLLLTRTAAQAAAAESITLRDALPPDEAAALLESLSGDRLADASRERLLDLLAGHPLALTWAGNLLARDDEHPETLMRDWTAAALPPLTDPTNNGHTLSWLFDRSARHLDDDAARLLVAAGLLAHAPLPLPLIATVLPGERAADRARASLKLLTGTGLLRIEASQPDHWQFAHVLAHRYARERADDQAAPAGTLAEALRAGFETDLPRAHLPERRRRLTLALDHARALLGLAASFNNQANRLVKLLMYDGQKQLLARGLSEPARRALVAAEVWFGGLPPALSERPEVSREHSVLHNQWAALLALQGDLPGARRRYEDGLAIRQRLAEADPGNAQLQRDLSVSFEKLGDVLSAQGDLPGARRRYEDGLAIRQRLAEADPGNAEWQRNLSVSFIQLGRVLSAQGDLPGARRRYEDGLAIAQRLAEADPGNAQWQRDLSVSFNKLGNVLSAQGDLPGARRRYEDGLAIRHRLAEADPGNAEWQRDLSVSFEKLGQVLSAQGDLPGARRRYEDQLAIAQRLAEADPGNAEWQRDLSVSFDKLGQVLSAQGDLPGARRLYEDGLAIRHRLAEADPGNAEWQRDLSVSFEKLGQVLSAQGDLPGARRRYEDGLAIRHRLAEADPGNAEWQRDLSVSFNKLGEVLSAQGDLPGARRRYEDGLAIAQRLAEADPGNAEWQRDLSVSFEKLGQVLSAQGDLPGARRRYEDGLAIRHRMAEADPGNAEWQRDLSVSFNQLGQVLSAQGDLPGARRRYEDGLAIAQRLAEADPGNAQWQRDLSVAFTALASLAEGESRWADARALAERSLVIGERLSALDPSNATYTRDVRFRRAQVERLRARIEGGTAV